MDNEALQKLRREYSQGEGLDPATAHQDPIEQFRAWFDAARTAQLLEPNAMALATVGAGGEPAVRMVLLKEFSEQGFTFFTNYESRKGRELAAHPRAALLFYWGEFERQIRIEGAVSPVSAELSDRYFQSRPRGAQLSAAVSPQSEVVGGRAELEEGIRKLAAQGGAIERPAHWGGYIVRPDRFEFWQGRENRLHDRVQYTARDGGWTIQRLAP